METGCFLWCLYWELRSASWSNNLSFNETSTRGGKSYPLRDQYRKHRTSPGCEKVQKIQYLAIHERRTRSKAYRCLWDDYKKLGRARDYGETIDDLKISSHTANKKIVMFIFILHCSWVIGTVRTVTEQMWQKFYILQTFRNLFMYAFPALSWRF